MLSEHKTCREIEDSMALEIRRQQAVIKGFKEILIALGMSERLVESVATEAYNKAV